MLQVCDPSFEDDAICRSIGILGLFEIISGENDAEACPRIAAALDAALVEYAGPPTTYVDDQRYI